MLLAEPITRSEVLARAVPWDNYLSGGILTQPELDMLKAYDKKSLDKKSDILDDGNRGQQYVVLFLNLLKKVSTPETLQYILATLNELVEADPERRMALVLDVSRSYDVYTPLLAMLRRSVPDWFVSKEASVLFTKLLCSRQCTTATDDHKTAYLQWLCQQLGREAPVDVRVAINALQKLLLVVPLRETFASQDGLGGLALLQRVAEANLGSPAKLQLLYEACCCIWLCLYSRDVAARPPAELVHTLVATIRTVQKEKVRRVCLAALRNMLHERDNRQKMVASLLHRLVATLRQRKWGDQEIEDDLTAIDDALQQEVQAMSSWDMYRTEVASGVLEWSPVHRSEHFWRENATRFEEENWVVLARLRELVRTSKDKQVLSIACYDLGEFVRFHPRGRTLLNQMNVKVELMQLLLHEDADVRKNALFSLQKIMSNRVEYSGV